MTLNNVSVENVTDTSANIKWSGSEYSYAKVSWPGGFSNIPYGIFSFNVPGLNPNSNANILVTPVTKSGKIVNTIAPPLLTVQLLPTSLSTISVSSITETGATVTWSGGVYSKVKVSWSGYSSGTSAFILTGISSYIVTGLTSNQSYTFMVTPYNANGELGTSNMAGPVTLQNSILMFKNQLEIVGGTMHTIVVRNSKIYAWGNNENGKLGDGTLTESISPKLINTGAVLNLNMKYVSSNARHAMAIDAIGNLYAWGLNSSAQLGNGNKNDSSIPLRINTGEIFNKTISTVSCGHVYTMAIDSSGKLYGWGNNGNGQLGDGTGVESLLPKRINQGAIANIPIVSVACGYAHTIAIDNAGKVYVWGINDWGQLGLGTMNNNQMTPILLNSASISGKVMVSAVAGLNCTILLDDTGTVYTSGYNGNGQLGVGSTAEYILTPQVVTYFTSRGIKILKISAGERHILAIDDQKKLYAWGWGASGQLGNGIYGNQSSPVLINGGQIANRNIVAIGCGITHSLAMDDTGKLYAFGNNDNGQLGDGTKVQTNLPVTTLAHTLSPSSLSFKVASGERHVVAVTNGGKLYAWGLNANGQLGNGNTLNVSTPVLINAGAIVGKTIVSVACGYSHTAAIDNSGKVYLWGSNSQGELGDGTFTQRTTPVYINTGAILGKKIIDIKCGYYFTIALDDTGKVYAWGRNNEGELGNGTTNTNTSQVPVIVNSGDIINKCIVGIACGLQHVVAIDDMGKSYAWGANGGYQLGIGTNIQSNTPSLMVATNISNVVFTSVSCRSDSTLLIDKTGNVYGCGNNNQRQVGLAVNNVTPLTLINTGSLLNKQMISLAIGHGCQHSLAIDSGFKLHAWGLNNKGQLGTGTTTNSAPVVINRGAILNKNIVSSACSGFFDNTNSTVVIDSTGNLYTWGDNSVGQLGNGTTNTTANTTPILISITDNGIPVLFN